MAIFQFFDWVLSPGSNLYLPKASKELSAGFNSKIFVKIIRNRAEQDCSCSFSPHEFPNCDGLTNTNIDTTQIIQAVRRIFFSRNSLFTPLVSDMEWTRGLPSWPRLEASWNQDCGHTIAKLSISDLKFPHGHNHRRTLW